MGYTAEDHAKLLDRLEALRDEKYRVFNEKLIPGAGKTYGVRMPLLRGVARELTKGDWRGFITVSKPATHEETLLRAMVIAGAKTDISEKLIYVKRFLSEINNWAVCDGFCSSFKDAAKNRARVREFISDLLSSGEEFILRFAAIMLMEYFITEEYIESTLDALKNIRHPGYYVKMGVAWALSVCYVKFPEPTRAVLQRNELDAYTHNKTIQKIRESYRVSNEDKAALNLLKRKETP